MIHRSELDFIGRCVLEYPTTETGGDLFGFWGNDGNAVIQYAIGPGQSTSRSGASFYQDIGYLRECGRILNGRFGLEHIGAWHSHHRMSLYEPSSGDVNTMQNAIRTRNLPRFIISICNIESDNKISIGCFMFSAENRESYDDCEWKILEGASPVRETISRDRSDLFRGPAERTVVVNTGSTGLFRSTRVRPSSEKPDFPEGSFGSGSDGRDYLIWAVDELRRQEYLFDVEILQLADRRVALSLKSGDWSFEIRFPNEFPKGEIEVVGKEVAERERNHRDPKVQPRRLAKEVLGVLNLTDKKCDITLRYR